MRVIRPLELQDIRAIVEAFAHADWPKPAEQYHRYLSEQDQGWRDVHVAFDAGRFTGYLTIIWESTYPPFRAEGIPEIVDFNVLPHVRRCGIGTQLMDLAEGRIIERAAVAGIGVGLYADYGAAQRLYVRRRYVPDGRGIAYDGQPVTPGAMVHVDDSLVLYFTKTLRPAGA